MQQDLPTQYRPRHCPFVKIHGGALIVMVLPGCTVVPALGVVVSVATGANSLPSLWWLSTCSTLRDQSRSGSA